ncbi:MAG: elongation factor G [Sedimentisphaerales bacterium]|nr:elongation factor G [Sedimentisphaerales bacterium]
MASELSKIRNIGIMAHIDAGKTTVTERILYFTGRTHKIGEVHDGTAVMDYLAEEQERGITITSAATTCPWKKHTINLIDTPGHVDFTVEVERSLRVLDGAVAVFDASEGVQAQSETVWHQAQKYGVPCICFINKMDKIGADFDMAVQSLREKLLAKPLKMQIPIGQQEDFQGFVDLLDMKACYFEQDKVAAVMTEQEIPADLQDAAELAHHDILEKAAEFDDALMEKYLEDQPLTKDEIIQSLRKGTLAGQVHPVFCGAALRSIGSRKLLDAIVNYLPSPLDRPIVQGHAPGQTQHKIDCPCDPGAPLVAYAFKIASDQHGDLTFVRIYSGTLKAGSRVLNATQDRKENVQKIFQMHAASRTIREQAQAGDIVALVGLKQILTGDTLSLPKKPVVLDAIEFPEPVMSLSIEPRTAGERTKLAEALDVLKREDPTFRAKYNEATGQTIISGMGELHLEILQHKITRDMKVDVLIGRPRVAYKETLTKSAQGEGKFIHQTGGRGQYGHVVIKVEHHRPGPDEEAIIVEDQTVGGVIPKEFIPSAITGIRDAATSGSLAGYPVTDLKIAIIDGSFHPVDSSEIAFQQAGSIAFQDASQKAGPTLLEPIMKLQVLTPEQFYGVVQGDLSRKRAIITKTAQRGPVRVIDATVPLAEMFGYASDLRSSTQGRGSYTMEPYDYAPMPEQVLQKVLETAY